MKPNELEEQITAYLLGELDDVAAEVVRTKIETDERCRALATDLEATLSLVRGALAAESEAPVALDPVRKAALLAAAADAGSRAAPRPEPEVPPEKVIAFPRYARWVAQAAAVVVIVGFLSIAFIGRRASPASMASSEAKKDMEIASVKGQRSEPAAAGDVVRHRGLEDSRRGADGKERFGQVPETRPDTSRERVSRRAANVAPREEAESMATYEDQAKPAAVEAPALADDTHDYGADANARGWIDAPDAAPKPAKESGEDFYVELSDLAEMEDRYKVSDRSDLSDLSAAAPAPTRELAKQVDDAPVTESDAGLYDDGAPAGNKKLPERHLVSREAIVVTGQAAGVVEDREKASADAGRASGSVRLYANAQKDPLALKQSTAAPAEESGDEYGGADIDEALGVPMRGDIPTEGTIGALFTAGVEDGAVNEEIAKLGGLSSSDKRPAQAKANLEAGESSIIGGYVVSQSASKAGDQRHAGDIDVDIGGGVVVFKGGSRAAQEPTQDLNGTQLNYNFSAEPGMAVASGPEDAIEIAQAERENVWKIEKQAVDKLSALGRDADGQETLAEAGGIAVFASGPPHPYVDTAVEPVSTFGIDVDTASYTLARLHIGQGFLPPQDAIRVEEVVNAFTYDYAPPVKQTFAVTTAYAPAPFGAGDLLRIAVKGKRIGRDRQQRAVLTFLVDTSGSMDTPGRLGLVKESLRMLVENLHEEDRVAIVQVDTRARLVLDHTAVSEREKILAAVANLHCSGSTHLSGGITLAYDLAAGARTAHAVNRVIILSDGAANLGSDNPETILKQVERQREKGITCSVFGFGLGTYNDVMLESLADKGDGAYRFIDSAQEARKVFVEDLAATLHTIASDVKIQVVFDPARVRQYRQLGYENRALAKEQFRDDTVDAGEVGSGQAVTALYELIAGADASKPIGEVRVRYKDLERGEVEEITRVIAVEDGVASIGETDPMFRLAAAAAEFGELLRGSPFAADGDYRDVANLLRRVRAELPDDPQVTELLDLVQRAPGLPRLQAE